MFFSDIVTADRAACGVPGGLRPAQRKVPDAGNEPGSYRRRGPDHDLPGRCHVDASVSKARVLVAAVLASVAFGVITVVLELAFPEKVLPILLNIVGSTCLLAWTSALLTQLALRLRADREGTALPLRMPGFPWRLMLVW